MGINYPDGDGGIKTISFTDTSSLATKAEVARDYVKKTDVISLTGGVHARDAVNDFYHATIDARVSSINASYASISGAPTFVDGATLNAFVHFPNATINAGGAEITGNPNFKGDPVFDNPVTNIPTAASSIKGGVKVGNGLAMNGDTLNAVGYALPTASTSTKGGVKVGNGLAMNGDTLNCTVSSNDPHISSGGSDYGDSLTLYNGVYDTTDGGGVIELVPAVAVLNNERATDGGVIYIGPNGYAVNMYGSKRGSIVGSADFTAGKVRFLDSVNPVHFNKTPTFSDALITHNGVISYGNATLGASGYGTGAEQATATFAPNSIGIKNSTNINIDFSSNIAVGNLSTISLGNACTIKSGSYVSNIDIGGNAIISLTSGSRIDGNPTITGNPTLSGNPVFTGTPVFLNSPEGSGMAPVEDDTTTTTPQAVPTISKTQLEAILRKFNATLAATLLPTITFGNIDINGSDAWDFGNSYDMTSATNYIKSLGYNENDIDYLFTCTMNNFNVYIPFTFTAGAPPSSITVAYLDDEHYCSAELTDLTSNSGKVFFSAGGTRANDNIYYYRVTVHFDKAGKYKADDFNLFFRIQDWD